jgi:RNA polymerase sigma-70 factor (ECF subfamily)
MVSESESQAVHDAELRAELELIERVRRSDDEAAEEMIRHYGPRLLAVTRRFLRNEDDAQEAVHDAFLSAFRSIDTFQGGSRLATWLHRIAVNAALMKLRKLQKHKERSIEELLPAFREDGHVAIPARQWKGPAEVEREETRQLVLQLIGELPASYRAILLLRDIEELTTEETAQRLEVTTGTVKTRLHRARQALRTLLDPHVAEGAA